MDPRRRRSRLQDDAGLEGFRPQGPGLCRLPAAFKDYVRAIEDLIETRVALISTGVEREDTIFLEPELLGLVDLESLKAEK